MSYPESWMDAADLLGFTTPRRTAPPRLTDPRGASVTGFTDPGAGDPFVSPSTRATTPLVSAPTASRRAGGPPYAPSNGARHARRSDGLAHRRPQCAACPRPDRPGERPANVPGPEASLAFPPRKVSLTRSPAACRCRMPRDSTGIASINMTPPSPPPPPDGASTHGSSKPPLRWSRAAMPTPRIRTARVSASCKSNRSFTVRPLRNSAMT